MLDYLNPLSDKFILKTIIDYLNPFSENFILKNVLSFLGSIVDYINPFSENFILKGVLDFLANILSYINPFSENFFGKKLVELIGELLTNLFVPSENCFEPIQYVFKDKFAFVDSIKTMISSIENMINNINQTPSLKIDIPDNRTGINELVVIDLSWYAPFKNYGDIVITGFCYVFFIWRLFCRLPNILHGLGSSGDVLSDIKEKGLFK